MVETSLKANPDRIKNLNINCTKEQGMEIVERFADREFSNIQAIDFPFPELDFTKCKSEWLNLNKKQGSLNPSVSSSLIRMLHPSMYYANKLGCLSPYMYWQKIREDIETFKKFYFNRLTRSDWFKVGNRKQDYLEQGIVPLNIYFCGLSTSGKAPCVGYFKPTVAKYIIEKYAKDFNKIFDPFSGYSGRMLGALASGKAYIGQDINSSTVGESLNILDYIKLIQENIPSVNLSVQDTFDSEGEYECLFTCSPYSNLESYNGKRDRILNCDEWIDVCLDRFKCKRYIFVTDDKISKYKNNVVETINNKSHWGNNSEFIVVL